MQVTVKPAYPTSGIPSQAIMRRLKGANALVGLGADAADTVGSTDVSSGALAVLPPAPTAPNPSQQSAWDATWQKLILLYGVAGAQALVNQNPAIMSQSTPYGTTIYYPTGTNPPVQGATGGAYMPFVILGGGVALLMLFMQMQRR